MFRLVVLLSYLLLTARRFATQEQAAARYQVVPKTVRNWISRGLITGYRLPGGRAVRVDLDECDRVLATIPATVAKPNRPAYGGAKIITVVMAEPDAGGE